MDTKIIEMLEDLQEQYEEEMVDALLHKKTSLAIKSYFASEAIEEIIKVVKDINASDVDNNALLLYIGGYLNAFEAANDIVACGEKLI